MTKASVSQHAIDRAVEHFRVSKAEASEWIRTNLSKATFVANIVAEDGKASRLFGFQRIAFVLAENADFVITLYPQNYAVTPMQRKIHALVQAELKRAIRRERAAERTVRVEKAKLAVEIAQCKLRMEMTPSQAVIRKNGEVLTQIDAKMAELDRRLFDVKRETTAVAKSAVMFS